MPREPQGAGYVLYRYRRSLIAHHGAYLTFILLGVARDKILPSIGELPLTILHHAIGLIWLFFGARLITLLQADSLRPWVYFKVMLLPFILGMPLALLLDILIN